MTILELIELNSLMSLPEEKEEMIKKFQKFLNTIENSSQAYLALFSIGVLQYELKRFNDAEAYFRHCLFQKPDFFICILNLGLLFENLNRSFEAIEIWKNCLNNPLIKMDQNKTELLNISKNLGRLSENLRDFETAEYALKIAYSIDNSDISVLQHLIHLRQKTCSWPINDYFGLTENEMLEKSSPMAILGLSDDPKMQFKVSSIFAETKILKSKRLIPQNHRYNNQKIKIAYLSSNLNMHAVSLLTVELFEKHNRDIFEIHAFCWSPDEDSSFRSRVVTSFDYFHDIKNLTDDEASELIIQNKIDIIIDLQGLTAGARVNLIAKGAAPIQISWLGFPGPTSIPNVDYIISDPFIMPDDLKSFFSETPLYLPRLFQVCDTKRDVNQIPDRASFGFSKDQFVFCAFNNNHKYTPQMFGTWMKILDQVPNSILWLLEDNQWSKSNLIRYAHGYCISSNRLAFAGRINPHEYLARFCVADLFLDTYPYNAGTTANDALWAGIPVLTMSGGTYASRMAGSLLNALGFNEMITENYVEYARQAIFCAQNPKIIYDLKTKLKKLRTNKNLFDIYQFTKEYENSLLSIVNKMI